MSEVHSNQPVSSDKPYPGFPLFRHAAGQWARKIRGKLHYFGKDADTALKKYLAEKDALHAGKKPREEKGELTVKELVNHFLDDKESLIESGELTQRTWNEYKVAADTLIESFGKTRLVADLDPDDFASLRKQMAKKRGPHRLAKMIQYVRSVFKHGVDAELTDKVIRFGKFKKPSKKTMRIHRAEQGEKLFTAKEILAFVDEAGPAMKAMILLGINAALGNNDVGQLKMRHISLESGLMIYPRPKTGINRRCPLWPETVQAIKDALAKRHEPKNLEDAEFVFITKYGLSWSKETSTNPVSQEMAKLLRKLKINGREGLGFYTLRHTFRTVADEVKDQPATDFIMGRANESMAAVYRQQISDERLKTVVDHVHSWLYGKTVSPGSSPFTCVRCRVEAGGVPAVGPVPGDVVTEVVVRSFQQRHEVDLAVEFLIHVIGKPRFFVAQSEAPAEPVEQGAKVAPAATVLLDQPGPAVERLEHAVVRRDEVDLRDRFVQQPAGLEGTQVVAPAVAHCRDGCVQLYDVGQEPPAVLPGGRVVAEPRQTVVLIHEGELIQEKN